MYGGRVSCIYTILLRKSILAHPIQALLVPANAKSTLRKKAKFPEATSLEPVQSRSTLRLHFDPPTRGRKLFRDCTGSIEVACGNLIFFLRKVFFEEESLTSLGKKRLM